jgi:hypothetical protein
VGCARGKVRARVLAICSQLQSVSFPSRGIQASRDMNELDFGDRKYPMGGGIQTCLSLYAVLAPQPKRF